MEGVQWRVVMMGESAVGKTSLLQRYIKKTTPGQVNSTVGAVFHSYETSFEGRPVSLQIWDTAGQERYRSIGPVYFRRAKAAVAVFDVTKRETMEALDRWITDFYEHAKDSFIVIAANKADLENDAEVTQDETIAWAAERGLECVWTSAMDGTGVEEVFSTVILDMNKRLNEAAENDSIALQGSTKSDSCC